MIKKFGMERLQKRIIEKKMKNPVIAEKLEEYNNLLKQFEQAPEFKTYYQSRGYSSYNRLIELSKSKILGRDIFFSIIKYAKKYKKRKIKILDDGAGRGYFLGDLKEMINIYNNLKSKNLKLETTAITLDKSKIKEKNIDHIYKTYSHNYTPSEKYDFIFSVFGGFTYTIDDIKKETMLKYIYSLNKGGIAVFSISHVPQKRKLNEILRTIEKRGFQVEFINNNNQKIIKENNYKNALIIKREK